MGRVSRESVWIPLFLFWIEEELNRPPLIRFGLERKSRLALAIENRYADFQGSGLRLRFSSASVAPDRKKTTRTALLIENLSVSNSACSAFFFGRLFAPTQPPFLIYRLKK